MRTIWKYAIPMQDTFVLSLPAGHRTLHVAVQQEFPHLWVEVDDDNPVMVDTTFYLVGTGNEIPRDDRSSVYRGTFQMSQGAFVFHIYEKLSHVVG